MQVWSDLATVFLMGALGSAHCVGMCAPFALAVSAGKANDGGRCAARLATRHLVYQFGKASAYGLIGVVLYLVVGWANAFSPLARAQVWMAWAAGGAMIVVGLAHGLGWRWGSGASFGERGGWLGAACDALRALWTAPNLWRCALTGWVNGFLPCGLSIAALLFLLSRDSLPVLITGVYVFGLGTTPALLALGWAGRRFSVRLAGRTLRVTGWVLVLFGVFTLFRGQVAMQGWLHGGCAPGQGLHVH